MYLAYFDESGDAGLVNSPTNYFVLACVLVHETDWIDALDSLIYLRRMLRDDFSIPTRPELKSTDLRRGRGPLTGLGTSLEQRMAIYRRIMEFTAFNLPATRIFAVAVNKTPAAMKGWEPRETAWRFALQRVGTFCNKADDRATIFPDEGHGPFIRRLIRRLRRHSQVPSRFSAGTLSVPLDRIIEDPNDRKSHDSYLVQLADQCAYAAHRSSYIDPKPGVPGDLWGALEGCLLLPVNRLAGGPPAIKLHP